jgi:hypothetical protein
VASGVDGGHRGVLGVRAPVRAGGGVAVSLRLVCHDPRDAQLMVHGLHTAADLEAAMDPAAAWRLRRLADQWQDAIDALPGSAQQSVARP